MFDDQPNEEPAELASTPAERAKEKASELRMHAELAAVFEGPRKFDAALQPGLGGDLARDLQRRIATLEKTKSPGSPVLPDSAAADAAALLAVPAELSTNDYHLHRRPGELMILRWLAGEQVELFYTRLQAHFDAGLEGYKEDERQATEWKKNPDTLAYLAALDEIKLSMADTYLRDPVRRGGLHVLSTITTDEINIAYLTDYIMGVTPVELVGAASAPPSDPSERDLAWFFKLFSLRGIRDGEERIFFFAYLQKTEDSLEDSW